MYLVYPNNSCRWLVLLVIMAKTLYICTMVNDEYIAKETANFSQINAIKLNPKNPFTWASGWKYQFIVITELYCLFLLLEKNLFFLSQQIKKYEDYDVIAGVATGAIE